MRVSAYETKLRVATPPPVILTPALMAACRIPVLWDYAVEAQSAAGKTAEQWVQLAQLKAQDWDVSHNSIRLLMQSDSQNSSRFHPAREIRVGAKSTRS